MKITRITPLPKGGSSGSSTAFQNLPLWLSCLSCFIYKALPLFHKPLGLCDSSFPLMPLYCCAFYSSHLKCFSSP